MALALMLLAWASVVNARDPQMGEVVFANGFDWPTQYAGGANYLWYGLGPGCTRGTWSLLPKYQLPPVRAKVQQQLATMYQRGMRTLAIGIYFHDGPPQGSMIDAGDASAVTQAAQNLHFLLNDIDTAGFQRVLFRFFPQGSMNPSVDADDNSPISFDPGTLPFYKNVIAAMLPKLQQGPLPYLVDLGVELAPADKNTFRCQLHHGSNTWKCPAYTDWSNAARELWHFYRDVKGYDTTRSVGFSFLGGTNRMRNRLRHMKYVYDDQYPGAYPSYLAVDVYGEPHNVPIPLLDHDAADQFLHMVPLVADYSGKYGFAINGIIISETWNNDPYVAANLSSAIAASGQTVRYLTQWPLDRGASCADVSETPPYQYDMYRMYGF